jgi:hypothetical protein
MEKEHCSCEDGTLEVTEMEIGIVYTKMWSGPLAVILIDFGALLLAFGILGTGGAIRTVFAAAWIIVFGLSQLLATVMVMRTEDSHEEKHEE